MLTKTDRNSTSGRLIFRKPHMSHHFLLWLAGTVLCYCLIVKLCPTLHDPMDQSMPGPPVFHCQFGQIHVGRFDDTVHPSRPLLSPSPLAFTPQIRVFSRESSLLMRWPKYWSLIFRICPSSEHSSLGQWSPTLGLQMFLDYNSQKPSPPPLLARISGS